MNNDCVDKNKSMQGTVRLPEGILCGGGHQRDKSHGVVYPEAW